MYKNPRLVLMERDFQSPAYWSKSFDNAMKFGQA